MISKIDMLEAYIKAGISPILFEDLDLKVAKNKVILESNCDTSLLNGHYEGTEFVPPEWFNKVMQNSKNAFCLLIIKEINKISKKEQLKFLELFKYKKIGTFNLPENCVIIATCSNLKENEISEEIYSLLAHI